MIYPVSTLKCPRHDLRPTFATAPFELLYHTSPGRGLDAPIEAILMILPPPCFCNSGIAASTDQKMLFTLIRKTRSNSASVTSAVAFWASTRCVISSYSFLITYLVLVRPPCIVDNDIQSTPFVVGLFHSIGPGVPRGHVHLQCHAISFSRRLCDRLFCAIFIQIGHDDSASLRYESLRDRSAKARAPAGHDGDFIL